MPGFQRVPITAFLWLRGAIMFEPFPANDISVLEILWCKMLASSTAFANSTVKNSKPCISTLHWMRSSVQDLESLWLQNAVNMELLQVSRRLKLQRQVFHQASKIIHPGFNSVSPYKLNPLRVWKFFINPYLAAMSVNLAPDSTTHFIYWSHSSQVTEMDS